MVGLEGNGEGGQCALGGRDDDLHSVRDANGQVGGKEAVSPDRNIVGKLHRHNLIDAVQATYP